MMIRFTIEGVSKALNDWSQDCQEDKDIEIL